MEFCYAKSEAALLSYIMLGQNHLIFKALFIKSKLIFSYIIIESVVYFSFNRIQKIYFNIGKLIN